MHDVSNDGAGNVFPASTLIGIEMQRELFHLRQFMEFDPTVTPSAKEAISATLVKLDAICVKVLERPHIHRSN